MDLDQSGIVSKQRKKIFLPHVNFFFPKTAASEIGGPVQPKSWNIPRPALTTLLKDEESARDNQVIACNLRRFKKNVHFH